MKRWTITIESKAGAEEVYVMRGDTAAHAKNRLRNRADVQIQFVKESRPWKDGDQKYGEAK